MTDIKTLKILLIEDPLMNLFVKLVLQKFLSYDVFFEKAECDTTAIQKCKEFQPDIIIITHGGATLGKGLELTREMLKDSIIKQIPVIMLSSLNGDEDKKYVLKLGVHTYLTYPVDKDLLVKTICQIADNKELSSCSAIQNPAHQLYVELTDERYASRPFKKSKLGEDMELVEEVIRQYWKPRFILDHDVHTAFEFMDGYERLMTVCRNDIMWETLVGMTGHDRAENLDAHYPTRIGSYKNGVAEVSWQINPDGRYFMDDDGFGMTDDEEETLYGYIDKQGRVVSKFRAISNFDELKDVEKEAIKNVNKV